MTRDELYVKNDDLKFPQFCKNIIKGGDDVMKKTFAFILSLMLLVAFTFAIGCKKAEEMAPAEAPAPATEPAPAPAPAPEQAAPAAPAAPAEQAPAQK
ncbi:MAG: hypothetical protein WC291_09455 [Thermodesulfovibrionales bacterium]